MEEEVTILDRIKIIEKKISKIEATISQIRISSQTSTQLLIFLLESQLRQDEDQYGDLINYNRTTMPLVLEKIEQQLKESSSTSKANNSSLSLKTTLNSSESKLSVNSDFKKLEMSASSSHHNFIKQEFIQDRWNFISDLQEFLSSYRHLTHLLIPKFFLNIIKELHHYKILDTDLLYECIQYPTEQLKKISTKLVKEAPSSQILQRLYNRRIVEKKDIEKEYKLNNEENDFIERMVENYYFKLHRNLETDFEDLKFLEIRLQKAVDNFSLGNANIETRIILVIYNAIKSIWDEIRQGFNSKKNEVSLLVKMATLDLIISSAKFLTQSKRFKQLLIEVKY